MVAVARVFVALPVVCVIVGAWLVPAWAAPQTQSTAGVPATADYVDTFIQRAEMDARGNLLGEEIKRLRTGQSDWSGLEFLNRFRAIGEPTQKSIAALLTAGSRPVEQDLRSSVTALDRQIQDTATAWRQLRGSLDQRQVLFTNCSQTGVSQNGVGWLFSLDDRWFWASVLLATAALGAIATHAYRHTVRRCFSTRRGRRRERLLASGVVALLVLIAVGLALGGRSWNAVAAASSQDAVEVNRNAAATDAPRAELAKAAAKVHSLEAERATVEKALKLRPADAKELAGLSDVAAEFRDHALEIGQRLAVLDSMATAVEADRSALDRLNEELAAAANVRASRLGLRRTLRVSVGLFVVGLMVVSGGLMRRGAKRRATARATTCPLCLGGIGPPPSPNGQASGVEIVRCENMLDPAKGIRCNYAIRDVYRPMAKICFPTLGVPRAGKTHWLAMLYWQLNQGNFPRSVRFEKIRSLEAASGEDFDRIVEQILISRLGTTGTQGSRIPHPLVFNFRDHDRWGTSNLLVNIFDYSGEITAAVGLDDYRRRRAIDADGYFFFLDPTLPAEPQARALAEFREDVRLVKGVGTSRPLQLPLGAVRVEDRPFGAAAIRLARRGRRGGSILRRVGQDSIRREKR